MHAQLLEDVRILAAEDMQGRDTGAAGGALARAYIVGRLEALGVAAPAMGREQPWERLAVVNAASPAGSGALSLRSS